MSRNFDYWWACIKYPLFFLILVLYVYLKFIRVVVVDVVVVDKYEGLKYGTTTFFLETCIKDDIKRCYLDTVSRRDYDMINIGEQWTLEVHPNQYK